MLEYFFSVVLCKIGKGNLLFGLTFNWRVLITIIMYFKLFIDTCTGGFVRCGVTHVPAAQIKGYDKGLKVNNTK